MYSRILGAIALAIVAGTSTAYAGGRMGSDPVMVLLNNVQRCLVMNISTKTLADVTVSMVKANAVVPEASTNCATLAPFGQCGFENNAPSSGARSCLVTLKGSSKALRGSFCNDNSGICASVR